MYLADLAAIILAGGRSRRMGTDKALLDLGGQAVIERIARMLLGLFPRILIVTNTPEVYRDLDLPGRLRIAGCGLRNEASEIQSRRTWNITDKRSPSSTPALSGEGEEGGSLSPSPPSFRDAEIHLYRDVVPDYGPLGGIYTGLCVSGCFTNLFVPCDMPFIDEAHIRPLVEHRAHADVVIYRHRKAEPLFGLYTQRCVPLIQEMIERGERCPLDLFPMVRLCQLPCSERDVAFFNLNTLQDYHIALEIAQQNGIPQGEGLRCA